MHWLNIESSLFNPFVKRECHKRRAHLSKGWPVRCRRLSYGKNVGLCKAWALLWEALTPTISVPCLTHPSSDSKWAKSRYSVNLQMWKAISKMYGVLVQVGSGRNKWLKISGWFQPISTVFFPVACPNINLLFPTSSYLYQMPQQVQCCCEGNALSSSVHYYSSSEHRSYEHYFSSSVHYCEDRFHIHVFLRSSYIWLSYIPQSFIWTNLMISYRLAR